MNNVDTLNMSNLEKVIETTYNEEKISNSSIKDIYEKISSADKYISEKFLTGKNNNNFNMIIQRINVISELPIPDYFEGSFLPNEIKDYILQNSFSYINFSGKIRGRDLNIYFIIFENLSNDLIREITFYVKQIFMWIYIIDEMATKNCSRQMNVYVYLTNFEKCLPISQMETIDSINVNTAFTSGCKKSTEIVIYRKEEWFKVFIHETFHNFGMEFSEMNNNSINNSLREIFNLNINYKFYEAYTETWARIINSAFYSYNLISKINNKSFNNFKTSFLNNLNKEALLSLYNLVKILYFFDIEFKRIVDKNEENITICNYLYKENTAVFSYFIISAIFMNNYGSFISWCEKSNNQFFIFKKTHVNINNFLKFLKKCLNNKQMLKNINKIEQFIKKNKIQNTNKLQMSLLNNADLLLIHT